MTRAVSNRLVNQHAQRGKLSSPWCVNSGRLQRSLKQRRAKTCKKASQASTSYDIIYTSEVPYYVQPEQKRMLQKISVVQVKIWLRGRRLHILCACLEMISLCSFQVTMT